MRIELLYSALNPLIGMCQQALESSGQDLTADSQSDWKAGPQVVVNFSGDLDGQLAVTFCGSVADQIVEWIAETAGDPQLTTDPVAKSLLRRSGMAEFAQRLFGLVEAHFDSNGVQVQGLEPAIFDQDSFHPTPRNLVARRKLAAPDGEVILELSAGRLQDDLQL
ncbi:MAG: hypothetical protein RL885_24320 [Planctomycetota bacterium]